MSVVSGEVFVQKDGSVDHVEYEQRPKEFDSPRVHVRFVDDSSIDKCVVQAGNQKPVFTIGTKQIAETVTGIDRSIVEDLRGVNSVNFYRYTNQVTDKFKDFGRLDAESRATCYAEHEAVMQAARQRVEDGNFTVGEAVAIFDAFQAQAATFGQPEESMAVHWSGMMA